MISNGTYLSNEPFLKVVDQADSKQQSFEDSPLDKYDTHGNKILKGTFQHQPVNSDGSRYKSEKKLCKMK